MRRYGAKRDTNEPEIVRALQLAGWSVFNLSQPGFPDLMCVRGGVVRLLEVKEPRNQKGEPKPLTPSQRETFPKFEAAGHRIEVVTTVVEALRALQPKPMGAAELAVKMSELQKRALDATVSPFDASEHERPVRKGGEG